MPPANNRITSLVLFVWRCIRDRHFPWPHWQFQFERTIPVSPQSITDTASAIRSFHTLSISLTTSINANLASSTAYQRLLHSTTPIPAGPSKTTYDTINGLLLNLDDLTATIDQAAATAEANAAAANAASDNERLRAMVENAASSAEAAQVLERGFWLVEKVKSLLWELAVLQVPVEVGDEVVGGVGGGNTDQ